MVSLACFFETGWLPACLLSEALREGKICVACSCGVDITGRDFFKYLEKIKEKILRFRLSYALKSKEDL